MDDVNEQSVAKLNKVLSRKHTIAILEQLSKGLKVNINTLKELGTERRTLYYILKELRENGLVIKKGNQYTLSILGFFVYNAENELIKWLENKNEIKLLNEYMNNSEMFKVTNALLKSLENIIGISKFEPVRIYTDWYSLVESLIGAIKTAKESIDMASRYIDASVLRAMLEAAKRGVTIKLITDSTFSAIRAKYYLALVSNEENKVIVKQLFTLKNVSVKTTHVPYSFIIIDQDQIGIEIPEVSDEKSFLLGLQLKSPTIAEKMSVMMKKIYANAVQDSVIYTMLQEVNS
ncbi:MAG: phospholipase D-like domain-containing protein [Conexivisphaerales archaeon]